VGVGDSSELVILLIIISACCIRYLRRAAANTRSCSQRPFRRLVPWRHILVTSVTYRDLNLRRSSLSCSSSLSELHTLKYSFRTSASGVGRSQDGGRHTDFRSPKTVASGTTSHLHSDIYFRLASARRCSGQHVKKTYVFCIYCIPFALNSWQTFLFNCRFCAFVALPPYHCH